MTNKIDSLIELLKKHNWSLVTIESASCGALANIIGNYSGVSQIYIGGFITYWTQAKNWMIDVDLEKLEKYGAVSSQIAYEMAEKGQLKVNSNIAISITGNAGPNPMEDKPVGLFYVGITFFDKTTTFTVNIHDLGRQQNRISISVKALELLYDYIQDQIK